MKTLIVCLCLVMLGACNKKNANPNDPSPTPTPTPTPAANQAPTILTMSVTPAFGIAFLTTFSFSAVAADPDGDPVTYSWNVAGNPSSGPTGQIVFAGGGNGTATVTVTDGKGGVASDSRTFIVGTLTGTWDVVGAFCDPRPFTLTLTQTAGQASGTFSFPNAWCAAPAGTTGSTDPAEPGTITAAGKVDIRLKVGVFTDFYLRGVMNQTGQMVTGGMFNSGFDGQPFTMTKR